MALYNEVLPEFQTFGAELIGVSVDGAWCHEAFALDRHLHFPLAADFEPKGEVARSYGAYRTADGISERSFCDRPERCDRLELLLADRHQSRSRRYIASS